MENLSSVTSESTNVKSKLESLPNLVYCHLFKYLDLEEILKLRLISKRFYFIVKDYEISQINFTPKTLSHLFDRSRGNWFSTSKSIKINRGLSISKLGLLKNPSINTTHLKYLKIFHPFLNLNDLNKFTHLQVLEIDGISLFSDYNLKLPDLKALSIQLNLRGSGYLAFDTPNLRYLGINFDFEVALMNNHISFKNPLTVRTLRTSRIEKCLFKFENLECLEVDHMSSHINRRFRQYSIPNLHLNLLMFAHLKQLKINNFALFLPYYAPRLKEIFKLRKGLQIVLEGVKIKNIDKIDEYESITSLEFQLNNYADLEDDLSFCKEILYNVIPYRLPKNQPSDLFKKYTNIQSLEIISKIEDENRLINFIKECHNLVSLCFYNSSLSQQFYDELPAVSRTAIFIISNNTIELNYEFIMKMKYLIHFYVSQNVFKDRNLINLNDLNNLQELKFYVFNHHLGQFFYLEIFKQAYDKYEIKVSQSGYASNSNITDSSDNTVDVDTVKKVTINVQECYTFIELLDWLDYIQEMK